MTLAHVTAIAAVAVDHLPAGIRICLHGSLAHCRGRRGKESFPDSRAILSEIYVCDPFKANMKAMTGALAALDKGMGGAFPTSTFSNSIIYLYKCRCAKSKEKHRMVS